MSEARARLKRYHELITNANTELQKDKEEIVTDVIPEEEADISESDEETTADEGAA